MHPIGEVGRQQCESPGPPWGIGIDFLPQKSAYCFCQAVHLPIFRRFNHVHRRLELV